MQAHLFDQMEAIQRRHFWFRARARIVLALLERHWTQGCRVLDAGCGTGLLLSMLPADARLSGLDPSEHALEHARRTLSARSADLRKGSLPDALPFPAQSQDLILLTDVLEHIEDDGATLRSLRALLAPGGRLLITVPAYGFLWSRHDEEHEHFRRYTRSGLATLLAATGLRPLNLSYYNTLLFPLVLVIRVLKRITGDHGGDMDLPSPPVNELMYRIFAFERHWTGRLPMPFGVSLIALVERAD